MDPRSCKWSRVPPERPERIPTELEREAGSFKYLKPDRLRWTIRSQLTVRKPATLKPTGAGFSRSSLGLSILCGRRKQAMDSAVEAVSQTPSLDFKWIVPIGILPL